MCTYFSQACYKWEIVFFDESDVSPRAARSGLHELHLEVKGGSAGDDPTGSPVSIAELWRDQEPPLSSDLHGGDIIRPEDAEVPALDHLAGAHVEGKRSAPVVARVELLPVRELADVMGRDLLTLHRLLPVSDTGRVFVVGGMSV